MVHLVLHAESLPELPEQVFLLAVRQEGRAGGVKGGLGQVGLGQTPRVQQVQLGGEGGGFMLC